MSHADLPNATDVTQDQNSTQSEGGAGTSTSDSSNNDSYVCRSLNSTDSDRRTDIRQTDAHYSWRQVAAACHVRPGR